MKESIPIEKLSEEHGFSMMFCNRHELVIEAAAHKRMFEKLRAGQLTTHLDYHVECDRLRLKPKLS